MLDGSVVDQNALDRVTDALQHRGPDGRGTYCDGSVGLGHRRLSVLDLTEAAHQPMVLEDGSLVLIFNGEIYNFKEERAALESKGYRFRSTGDTEVLLKLYEEYGEGCLEHLRGMFAFAIYDRRRRVLFLARDRVGKKPLKYFRSGGIFAFASQLKALRTLRQCPREMDLEQIHHFLTMMYLPAPLTGFSGIHKLPAAHALTIDLETGKEHLRRYWSLSYEPDPKPTVFEWEERLRASLEESIRLRMIADVPIGLFLSGGIDSATVAAMMSRLSSRPIKTFSIGFEGLSRDELDGADRLARHVGADHHPIVLRPSIFDHLPDLVSTYEEPYADPAALPMFLLAREARKEVTVALNGDGGDENFAGYVRYPILRFSRFWERFPAPMHALARLFTGSFLALHRSTLSYRMDRFEKTMSLPWEQRYLQYLSFFTEEEKLQVYGSAMRFPRTDVWYTRQTQDARRQAQDCVSQAMSMDVHTYLADDLLPKVDLATMAHGLEARSPFLDHRFLELTASIPIGLKLRGRVRKWILKDMVRGMVPAETIAGKKRGFRLPYDEWFRGPLHDAVRDRLLSAAPNYWSMFERSRIERFLKNYGETRIDYSDHVLALLWLAEWMRQYT